MYSFKLSLNGCNNIFNLEPTVSNVFMKSPVYFLMWNSDSSDGEVDVMYMDYGSTEFVPKSHLITQLSELVNKSQTSAFHCQLNGIGPVSMNWMRRLIFRCINCFYTYYQIYNIST